MQILETERLTLREFTLEDAPFILRLLNEPSFLRFVGDRGVRTLEGARDYLAKGPIDSYRQFGFGLYLTCLNDGGASIGTCGLLKRETLPDVDIGFAFLPEFWKRGYAFESAAAMLDHGRDVLKLDRIIAITSPDNERSADLLVKLGLRFEKMVTMSDDSDECRLFALELDQSSS